MKRHQLTLNDAQVPMWAIPHTPNFSGFFEEYRIHALPLSPVGQCGGSGSTSGGLATLVTEAPGGRSHPFRSKLTIKTIISDHHNDLYQLDLRTPTGKFRASSIKWTPSCSSFTLVKRLFQLRGCVESQAMLLAAIAEKSPEFAARQGLCNSNSTNRFARSRR